jgi:hypothetical protein
MMRILMMANDSLLADAVASTLAGELDLDVVRVTRLEPEKGNRHSVVIVVDQGESEGSSIRASDLFRSEITLLVIKLSLSRRNIHVIQSYQLNNPEIEQVIDLVREFGRTNLKKKVEAPLMIAASDARRLVAVPVQAGMLAKTP